MTISMRDLFRQSEFWAYLFVLGAALLNWPILSLAANDGDILGVPAILAYIALVWILIIAVAYLFDRRYSD
ncbi:MAG TPA: hypothetical protein VN455_01840 [Methanotrichaceae archaeon]|nr:hypothetical protein [Methanotrichaceae archaeon]